MASPAVYTKNKRMSNRLLPVCLLAAFALLAVYGCCKTSGGGEEKKYRFTDTLQVGGMQRSYLLNLPPELGLKQVELNNLLTVLPEVAKRL